MNAYHMEKLFLSMIFSQLVENRAQKPLLHRCELAHISTPGVFLVDQKQH